MFTVIVDKAKGITEEEYQLILCRVKNVSLGLMRKKTKLL
jgi:hypothetical protein